MILPNDIKDSYSELGHGSLKEIMKVLGMTSHTHVSNIMSGKKSTSITNIAKIKKYVDKQKALMIELSHNDQN